MAKPSWATRLAAVVTTESSWTLQSAAVYGEAELGHEARSSCNDGVELDFAVSSILIFLRVIIFFVLHSLNNDLL
jgi:hypothetical protein